MENIRQFNMDSELSSFLLKKRTYKELELSSAKMFLLLEFMGINYNDFDEIAFEFMFRYAIYDIRQNNKTLNSVSEIRRRWKDFTNVYFVRLEMFRTVRMLVDRGVDIEELRDTFPDEIEMCENGHDDKSAMQVLKRILLYKVR